MDGFNVETGVRNINGNMKCLVPFDTGSRNERGERLLAEGNNEVIIYSVFQKAAKRYWAWKAPGVMTQNQTDFIMYSDRKTSLGTVKP